MKTKRAHKSLSALCLLVVGLIAIAGCNNEGPINSPGAEPDATVEQPAAQAPAEDPASIPPKPPLPIEDTASEDTLKIYWVSGENEEFKLVASPLDVDQQSTESDLLTQALNRLMSGPANADMSSAIPDKTQLNRLTIKADGVHVDLSKEFTSGGGSLSMQSRLGQVIYTASSIKPKAPIWISVDGEPLKVMGGEGLEIAQPITREKYNKEFSI
ncbi:MAG: GerMN domain-containing protein [Cyanobacteria bacterium P01_F01_bin.42]